MQQIGRYEIIAELGKGGMGVVWLANDPLLKRQVAIKSMLPQNQIPEGSEGIILERLKREAQAAAALNHPNIVSIYDVVPTPDSTYIVMEYVEGRTLAGLMTPNAPMDRAISLRILEQCAAALDHAHQKGIVHRDIKPENIMIDAAGNAKITDFGIARRMGSSATLTMGLAVGTLEYMSPQQLGSEAVDGLADQYSLAVVAYKMLTGHPIFDAEHIQSWCYAIATQKPVSASVRQALVPKTVDAVFEKALAKSPKDRYATCTEFVRQLAPAFAVEAPRAKPRRSAAVLAGAVVLGLLSGGAYLSRRSSPEPKPDPQVQPTAAPTVKPEPVAVATPLPSPTPPKSTPAPTPPPVVKATPAVKPAPEEPAARPASPSTGQVWRNPKDLLNYVWIPPGRFWMGCSPGDRECLPLERPIRDTEISEGFWLSQTEVTVGAWKLFVKSSGRMMPKPIEVQGFVINPGWAADDLPIMSVQWDLAAAFCEWTGGRLPSDSEWEYAARAGVRAPRYGVLGDIAWYGGNSGTLPLDDWDPATVDATKLAQRLTANKNTPHPVGQKQPNAWKLHDMLGNAWEWTADSVERRSAKKKANAGAGDIVHLLRGGSFVAPARQERASVRLRGAGPSLRFAGIGCRCALD